MANLWEMVTIVILGVMGMGQIISLGDSSLDIGAFGTSTSGVVEIFFFLVFAAVVFEFIRNYIM